MAISKASKAEVDKKSSSHSNHIMNQELGKKAKETGEVQLLGYASKKPQPRHHNRFGEAVVRRSDDHGRRMKIKKTEKKN